ncbi:MAG: DegT/DnrJ/EryC1/StrS family aminotransferase [Gemmatimonadota bacterium]
MRVPLLDLKAQHETIRDEIAEAVTRVVDAQQFVLGPAVERLEAELAAYLGVPHAIGCASGTDALLLPLKALDAAPGAEVVVPAFTFFATAGAVWNAGLRPVFCDVEPESFNVSADTVAPALGPRTRAVIPVHLFGQMASMAPLAALTRDREIHLLEDAAQAIGAWRDEGRGPVKAGAAGWAGAFSFFPTKNLGAFGDAGLVTTGDAALAERIRKLRVHGGRQMYHHEMVGTNSRLDALQAAVLSAKLPHLDGWAAGRRENAARYLEALEDVPEVILPVEEPGAHHVYNQFTVRVRRRDELKAFLDSRGIGSGIYYPVPLHLQACFAELGYRAGDLPVSETLCQQVLSLPIFPELGATRLEEVAMAIRAFYGHPA